MGFASTAHAILHVRPFDVFLNENFIFSFKQDATVQELRNNGHLIEDVEMRNRVRGRMPAAYRVGVGRKQRGNNVNNVFFFMLMIFIL